MVSQNLVTFWTRKKPPYWKKVRGLDWRWYHLGLDRGVQSWVKNSWGKFTPTACLLASSSLKELWGAAQERPAMRAGRKYFTNHGYVMIMTYNNNTTRVTWQNYHYPMNNLSSSDQIMLKRTLNQVVWKKFDCVNNGLACLKSPILVSLSKRLFTSRRLLDVRGFNMDITIKNEEIRHNTFLSDQKILKIVL